MKLNFIKDKEINLDNGDLLGTKPYVETLLRVIEGVDGSFTIGLFGGWGTGKSSIVRTIEEKYNNNNSSKTKVFVYDAWKYSKDAFRRTFILKLKDKFNLKEGLDYQNFYNDKHEEIAHKSQIDEKRTFLGLLYLLPLLINIIWFIPNAELDFKLTLTVMSVLSSVLTYFLKDIYVQYKISITKPKTFAPEQFERAFLDAINSVVGGKNFLGWFKFWDKTVHANKIVIVIDNIDRCHKDLAFELLLTVKTFLEQDNKEIVFILPIDENEIKKHIVARGYDGNEFLRKLFNTTLTVKKFSEDDLFNFTKKLQEEYKLEMSDDVVSLISQEFSRSPRKIIQFLNVLQTEIKLAEEQEKEIFNKKPNFKKGLITKNIEFLVKVLLIREEWTDLYNQVKENPYLLDDINKQIDDGEKGIVYGKAEKQEKYLTTEQVRFFESTRYIYANNIEAFFSNKDAFPEFPDDLPKLVLKQDWETVKGKYLDKDTFEFSELLFFIDTLFKREVVQRKLMGSSFNIFHFIFKLSVDNDYKEVFLKCFQGDGKPLLDIKTKLNGGSIGGLVLHFDPKLLLNFIKLDLDINNRLFQEVVKVINQKSGQNGHRKLLVSFVNEFQSDEIQLREVGETFSSELEINPTLFNDFKDLLENDVVVGALIKADLLKEFIEKLKQDFRIDFTEDRVGMIRKYNSSKGLSDELLTQYVTKIVELLSGNGIETDTFWLKQLTPFVRKVKVKSIEDSIFAMLTQKYSFLFRQYGSQWDQESYQDCLNNFLVASSEYYILSGASASEVETWFRNFFSKEEDIRLALTISKLYRKTIEHCKVYDWSFSSDVIDKFNRSVEWEDVVEIAKTLNSMLLKTEEGKGLTTVQIQEIINVYISKIKINNKVVEGWLLSVIKNTVVKSQLIEVIDRLSIDDSLEILGVIKNLDKDLLKDSVEKIILETDIENLEENFKKLDNSDAGLTLINGGIERAIKSLAQEEGDDCKGFLNFIVDRKNLPERIGVAIVSKIKSFLNDEKTREDKIFALQILDRITIPSVKRSLVKSLLEDLKTEDFKDDDKVLLMRVKGSVR